MRKIGYANLVAAVFGVALPLLSQSQTPAARKPSFEVISVKPSPPDNPVRGGGPRGDRYNMSGVTLRNLLQTAYQRLNPRRSAKTNR